MTYLTNLLTGLLMLGFFALPAQAAPKTIKIAASIRPLYGIAAAVGGDAAKVSLILDTPVSPHDAAARPSDIQKISQADIILLIDRNFEKFMQRPLETYGKNRTVIEFSKAAGLEPMPREVINADVEPDWRRNPKTLKELTGEDDPKDFHMWLDPQYAITMGQYVHQQLLSKMPERKEELDANLMRFIQDVYRVQSDLAALFPHKSKGFIAAHGSYQYFSRSFMIRQYGTIEDDLTGQTDPVRSAFFMRRAAEPSTACIVQDTETTGKEAQKLAKQFRKPLITVDPLGQSLPLDGNLYPSLLYRVGKAFADCLKG